MKKESLKDQLAEQHAVQVPALNENLSDKTAYPIHLQMLFKAVEFALQKEEVFMEIARKRRRKEVPFYKQMKIHFNTNGIKVHKNTYPKGTKMSDVVFEICGLKYHNEVGHRTILQSKPAFWTLNKAKDGFQKMDEGGVDPPNQICIEILTDFVGECEHYRDNYPVFQSYLGHYYNSQDRNVRLQDVKTSIAKEYGNNLEYFTKSLKIEHDLKMHLHIWVIWRQF